MLFIKKGYSLLLIYFSFLLSYVEYLFRGLTRKRCRMRDFNKFVQDNKLSTKSAPEDIANALRDKFTWREDTRLISPIQLDYAKHPMVFLYDGRDDCDGFARFAEFLLSKLGFENVSRVYVMADNGAGHAVCVAKVGDYHFAFGNWKALQLTSNDLEDIGNIVSRVMKGNLDIAIRFRYNTFVEMT